MVVDRVMRRGLKILTKFTECTTNRITGYRFYFAATWKSKKSYQQAKNKNDCGSINMHPQSFYFYQRDNKKITFS